MLRAKRDKDNNKQNKRNPIYDYRWRKARERFIEDKPYCAICEKVAKHPHVDHIIKHDNDIVKFWDESNWRVLCPSCHSVKTSAEHNG